MARKKHNSAINKILFLFFLFGIFICANRYLSDLIINNLHKGINLPQNKIIMFDYVQNNGAAFNILNGNTTLLILLALVALIFLFAYIIKNAETMSYNGIFWLSFLMSGIFCNCIERVSFGYVRDYFSLVFMKFPVFNISDIAINIGVLAVVILLFKRVRLSQL